MCREDGTPITKPEEVAQEICDFYKNLMGTNEDNIKKINISAMSRGPQLTMSQRASLIVPVTVEEVKQALKGIGDLKSPSIDGYGARFFKANWDVIAEDLTAAVKEFF